MSCGVVRRGWRCGESLTLEKAITGMDIAGWDEMYRSGQRGKEDAPTLLLVEMLDNLRMGAAIDLACGTGRNAIYMAERGWAVTAMDGSEKAIELLQERSAARNLQVHARVTDLTDPIFTLPPDAFDLVLIAYYLQRDLFAPARSDRRPGGIVITTAHRPDRGAP